MRRYADAHKFFLCGFIHEVILESAYDLFVRPVPVINGMITASEWRGHGLAFARMPDLRPRRIAQSHHAPWATSFRASSARAEGSLT
jgi:hypothetical protein